MSDHLIPASRILKMLDEQRELAKAGIMSAVGALGEVRDWVLAEVSAAERATQPEQSGELAPLPGGGYSRTKFDLDQVRDIHRDAVQLSKPQRTALLVLFETAPRYAEGVVPGEYLSGNQRTLAALAYREFIGWHDLATDGGEAHWGYRLTEAGRHAVGKLIALATNR